MSGMQIVWIDAQGWERHYYPRTMGNALAKIAWCQRQGVRWTAIPMQGGVPGIS